MREKGISWMRKNYDNLLLAMGQALLFLLVIQTFQTYFALLEMPVLDVEAAYQRRAMLDVMKTLNKYSCLFAGISCLFLSEIWIGRRKREYGILRILGYGGGRLFGKCLWESGRVMGLALLVSAVLQGVLLIWDEGERISIMGEVACLGYSVLGALLLHLVVMGLPFLRILWAPLHIVRQEGE